MANVRFNFDKEEKTIIITFRNGEESKPFKNKIELFSESLKQFVKDNKLTTAEAEGLYISALALNFVHQEPTAVQLFAYLFKDVCHSRSIAKPKFRACECGQHGLIVFKVGDDILMSEVIFSKTQGIQCANYYQEEFNLNIIEVLDMITDIKNSSLPEEEQA